jgi:hypothetical protein
MDFYKLLDLVIYKYAVTTQKCHYYAHSGKMCAKNKRKFTYLL